MSTYAAWAPFLEPSQQRKPVNLPPPPENLPSGALAVAVTGHQDLGPARTWVSAFLLAAVQDYPTIQGLSSLARGADQLFADAVLRTGQPLVVVIPCAGYKGTFESADARDEYARLLAAASERVTLPFPAPSEEAFWAAGRRLVDEADVVIAVWDGEPAGGLGGTADVVDYARSKGRGVLHANPTTQSVTWI